MSYKELVARMTEKLGRETGNGKEGTHEQELDAATTAKLEGQREEVFSKLGPWSTGPHELEQRRPSKGEALRHNRGERTRVLPPPASLPPEAPPAKPTPSQRAHGFGKCCLRGQALPRGSQQDQAGVASLRAGTN